MMRKATNGDDVNVLKEDGAAMLSGMGLPHLIV